MNLLDRWREIFDVLVRRKLRTALTALSVAWGIFMLVVLLAAGDGLATGVESTFALNAVNSVFVMGGQVSKAHAGNPIGKRVALDAADFSVVKRDVPRMGAPDIQFSPGAKVVSHGNRHATLTIRGCFPGRAVIHAMQMEKGRFINDDDLRERRRVACIDSKAADGLFAPGENPLGQWITVADVVLQVVGVYEESENDDQTNMVYMPQTTAQIAFAGGNELRQIAFTLSAAETNRQSQLDDVQRDLASRKNVATDDKRAIRIRNTQEMFDRFNGLFQGIRAFVWLIGLGTILAGVVGVSNIMLISVAERTREIGVRKAVGATPSTIVRMIVEEALVITCASGYLGLVAAVAVVNVAARLIPKTEFFASPQVNLSVGLAATGILVLAGTIAGLFPALRAARINPIAALRVE